jgi:hypothetical protein
MRLILLLLAVGSAMVVLRIFFALKAAHGDDPQHQKTSREEKPIAASTVIAVGVRSAVPSETNQLGVLKKEM